MKVFRPGNILNGYQSTIQSHLAAEPLPPLDAFVEFCKARTSSTTKHNPNSIWANPPKLRRIVLALRDCSGADVIREFGVSSSTLSSIKKTVPQHLR